MRKLFIAIVFFSVFENASAQQTTAYQNSEGEEIFGPAYMPQSADDPGVPLYLGRPAAGVRPPDSVLQIPQDAFNPATTNWALPKAEIPRELPGDVPFLRDLRSQFRQASPNLKAGEPKPNAGLDPNADMKVHFVDVGQGAGAIVELPCGVAVIDTGGEFGEIDGGTKFVEYLQRFLAAHPQYNNTVDVAFISHPHADHLNGAAKLMASGVQVAGMVDNGQTGTSGQLAAQVAFRDWVKGGDPRRYTAVEVKRQTTATGATNSIIDPFSCATVTAFWGGANEKLAEDDDYRNPNNHSVVVRIDFGNASFLFMGDMERKAANDMLEQYDQNIGVFDADVLLLAHHGAENGISDRLLQVISPRIAVISMGSRNSDNAIQYGHPRTKTLSVLQDEPEIVSDARPAATYWTSPGAKQKFESAEVIRAIYGTGWEGTIIVDAKQTGDYRIDALENH